MWSEYGRNMDVTLFSAKVRGRARLVRTLWSLRSPSRFACVKKMSAMTIVEPVPSAPASETAVDDVAATPSQVEMVSAKDEVKAELKLYDLVPVATDEELQRVEELRSAVLKELGEPLQMDKDTQALLASESLLRFVRARPTIAASTTMLLASLSWRERRRTRTEAVSMS